MRHDASVMELDTETEGKLHELVSVFLEENAKVNLSALRTQDQCWIGNVMDSVEGLRVLSMSDDPQQILDVGTGGGFPLLPGALCYPQHAFVGIDATQKKIDAIGRIVDQLGIENVQLVCGRTEELGRDVDHREHYDMVTARAVAPLNVLLEYAAPFVKVGGIIACWKSMTIDTELQESLMARAELSCQLEDRLAYDLGGDWGKRQILVFRKRAALSDAYPRGVGIPKKQPLV